MKHRIFADSSDSSSDGAAEIYVPPSDASVDGHANAAPTPVVVPAESVEAQSAQDGAAGPGAVVAETSGGITFNLIFDTAAVAAPQSFRNGIEQAASLLSRTITDKITVNIGIATKGDPTFNALPTGSTIQGQSQVAFRNAQLKLFGLLGANDTTTDDGSATFCD